MASRFALIGIVYATLVVDTVWSTAWAVGGVAPDLTALCVFVWLLAGRRSPLDTILLAAIGLLWDLHSPGRLGWGMMGCGLASFGVARAKVHINDWPAPAPALVTGGLTAALLAWVALAGYLFGEPAGGGMGVFAECLAVGAYTGAASLPVWMVLGWLGRPRAATFEYA